MIMFGAAMIFALLSIFYYDYVPEDAFVEAEADEENPSIEKAKEAEAVGEDKQSIGKSNSGYESDEL